MKYKHIIFDFGNVLGSFDKNYILKQFCHSQKESPILYEAVYKNWQALDEGSIDYEYYIQTALASVPPQLHPQMNAFFRDWYHHLPEIPQTRALFHELKARQISVYLLSNASSYFAEHAMEICDILSDFDGILFSGPVHCAKPDPKIYHLLFERFHLTPEECFFIDDNADNIKASKSLGMDGIVFTGDIEAVRHAIEF